MAAERCARIVRSFLTLARRRPTERRLVRVNDLVADALDLVTYALRVDDVEAVADLAPDLPPTWADPDGLHQVVLNLLTNAHQAMRGSAPPRRLAIATRYDPARGQVVLEVIDTGPGIDAEVRARLFEPFFTTKPVGQGTGLGLSLCHRFVEEHGGTIEVESAPGAGALFRVRLPVTPAPAERQEPAGGPGPGDRRVVLLVDDEPDVAQTLTDMLVQDGHQVDVAATGQEALARLRERRYDVILSDVRMPQMDGPALYREVGREHPEILPRFVFITGDALDARVVEFLQQADAPRIEKPFTLDDVRLVIHRASPEMGTE